MREQSHTVRVRAAVPGGTLRILLLLIAVGATLILNPYVPWQVASTIIALVAAVAPSTLAAWGSAACIAVSVLIQEPSPWRTALAVAVIPLLHVLGGLTLVVPSASRLQLRALLPSARRYLLVQLVSQPIALLVMLIPRIDEAGAGYGWLAPIGAVILVGAAVLTLRALRR